ncbi:ATP-binding protein [Candidatus Nitrospira bockiana]
MSRMVRLFNNLPIERKLLLTSVIPLIALLLMSLIVYRTVRSFEEDEDQVNRVYLTQRTAAEYMRLVVDMESGFRGFVVSRQERYLEPYLVAHSRILSVGDSLDQMVHGLPAQHRAVQETQRLIKQLINEKDQLIKAVRAGHTSDALHYIEQGRGRDLMQRIRSQMKEFDRLEQDTLNEALASIAQTRTSMGIRILSGFLLALGLMIVALHLIAKSMTRPLVSLAKSVRSATVPTMPDVPVLERGDELGELTRVMSAMSHQVQSHLAQLERSRAELQSVNAELAASESKYRNIVDHAPFGIFTTQGMALTFTNRYNRMLAGLDPNEEGDPEAMRDLIHPDDRERVLAEFAKAVEEGRACELVFRFLHKDGTVRKVLSRRIPIRDEHGRTVMYQGFNIDITALDQMQTQLSRAERLATLGQVAAGIAHEIRNPLVGIGSTAALLVDEVDADDARRADLEVILSETRRLDRIVNQIIDYARPRELAPVLFSVADVVQEVLKLLDASIAAKHLAVQRAFHPMLPQVQADRDQIKQVLLNLFQNAIEAMGDGGTLSVNAFESRRTQQAGMIVDISDTGRGIAPDDLPHVFQPFFTSGKHRGTGLGLAICRNIVDAHGGDIHVSSQPGKGTTVRVWLPLRQQPRMATV